jgi:hypothetical protein
MSLEQVAEAELAGYGSPIYPEAMAQLALAFVSRSRIGLNRAQLERAARSIHGSVEMRDDQPINNMTQDGYRWFGILEFEELGAAKIAIAFPMLRDWEAGDDSRFDRSPAAYITGGATPVQAQRIAALLAESMRLIR